jgi:fermentation-respiration switch protein FrsA (DUF1100 family)
VLMREQTATILSRSGASEETARAKLADLDAEIAKLDAAKSKQTAGSGSAVGVEASAAAAGSGSEEMVLGAPLSYWASLHAYDPIGAAKSIRTPFLILQGERDYQVTMTDLAGWRNAIGGRPGVEIRSYPGLNHLFVEGLGPSTPSEYDEPGHVSETVIKDLAAWIKRPTPRD